MADSLIRTTHEATDANGVDIKVGDLVKRIDKETGNVDSIIRVTEIREKFGESNKGVYIDTDAKMDDFNNEIVNEKNPTSIQLSDIENGDVLVVGLK